jgi:flagellum-specific peptidoglycan hydrolase FlgJ
MIPSDFIKKFSLSVIEATAGSNLFPSVKMAQMALESSWGSRHIANNYFGIKARGQKSPFWDGSAVDARTSEVINDNTLVQITDAFRAYKSVEDSIRDHSYFLRQNPRYALAGVFESPTPEAQAKALQRAGYATDPLYAEKLISIIKTYKLETLDQKKK